MNTLAIDIGLGFGPTPLVMLTTVLVLVVILAGIFLLLSQIFGGLVDKRWPADQALTPAELLWGEVGGHVQKTFPGLDPEIAEDLSPFVVERKLAAGDTIVEAGLPAVQYHLVVKGEVLVHSDPPVTLGPGGHFGGDDILHRSANSHTVVASAESTIISLPADDYIAGLALGAEVDDDEYVDHALQQIVNAGRIPAPAAAAPMDLSPPTPTPAPADHEPPPQPAPAPAADAPPAQPAPEAAPQPPAAQPAAQTPPPQPEPQTAPPPAAAAPVGWADATHRVGDADLPGYPLPEGDAATVTLPAGTPVLWVEGLPGWAHVRTEGAWQGWVRTDGIVAR